MYNIDKEMRKFYRTKVVLAQSEQKSLIEKKDLNLDRLKGGLKEYNEENDTNYKIVDSMVQGSVAMQTVVQAEENNYDIDVGIVFNKSNLPAPKSSENNTTTVKNIVHDALLKKSSFFKTPPEKRTNCIRIQYANGYHIDFAIYRREKNEQGEYIYQHCGADWNYRNPRSITKWFKERDRVHSFNLKRIVRLLKAYLKQDSSWSVPGGLIQSVLADECIQISDRLDKMLYDTIIEIINRLDIDTEAYNPVDTDDNGNKITLLTTESHKDKMTKMKNYLDKGIKKLSVLFDESCTKEQAFTAWADFFNHNYWTELAENSVQKSLSETFSKFAGIEDDIYDFDETEEFIEDLYPISSTQYSLKIECKVEQKGYRIDSLQNFLRFNKFLNPHKKLHFKIIENTVPYPYKIFWKVLNRGKDAERRNEIRGQIIKGNSGDDVRIENTKFSGNHIVYCYIVKDGECVAKDSIIVPIEAN
ncbi:nucleotide-binding domain-containing protein [Clostridium formicaceticum]|uniref:Cyclic GMP-AMP synthase n=1 Tax=Clostridium formicaceticum TaxID=1497 RepID=A0AAC9RQ50_9CLOT|nr:hypothetical protein [Clostridium formicaceticum]AOY78213.1 hypothetical protein BJL90_02935 [Clostridium formicaceticum]ARE89422.1 hypothetical protein CLFO_38290 [Clostridium formicaceticum]